MKRKNSSTEYDSEVLDIFKKSWRAHSKILPFSRSIEFRNFDIYSWIVFANKLGGDHRSFIEFAKRYDLEYLKDLHGGDSSVLDYENRLGIFIADVSGHDFEDVLLVHNIHSSLFTAIPYELELHGEVSNTLFERLNTRLFNSTHKTKYVTAIYSEINTDSTARFIVAGHPLPIVYDTRKDEFIDIDFDPGFPLGLFQSCCKIDQDPDVEVSESLALFKTIDVQLPEKCIIVMYTDGFTEVENSNGEQFGLDRLKEIVIKNRDKTSKKLFREILYENNQYLDPGRPLDDRTMVVIKCDGNQR